MRTKPISVLLATVVVFNAACVCVAVTSPSLCCPADLSANGDVAGEDIGTLLSNWGSAGAGDLDESGAVDGADIGLLMASWGMCPSPCLLTLVAGHLQLDDGTPVVDAVVVTDQGGTGISDAEGLFAFEVLVENGVEALHVVATAHIRGVTYSGKTVAGPILLGGSTDVGKITMSMIETSWLPTFGGQPGVDKDVLAIAVFDDGRGGGPAIYAAGYLIGAGGTVVNHIAKWDGTTWSVLAGGMNDEVRTLAVFDDGTGGGPALYAGGAFTTAGGQPANHVAKWDGTSWSPLGSGTNQKVRVLRALDLGDGRGTMLVTGGEFSSAGGVPASSIARWDGSAWSPLSDTDFNSYISALALYDDGLGGGTTLYVGGGFTHIDGQPTDRIARWSGTAWLPVAGGVSGLPTSEWVDALVSGCDGEGQPVLYVGGRFGLAGTVACSNIAQWNGSSWSPLGSGLDNPVSVLEFFANGPGEAPALFAGGSFSNPGGTSGCCIAQWDGTGWTALSDGPTGSVLALQGLDDGSGRPSLYVGGGFLHVGGVRLNHIALWDGLDWLPLGGTGVSGPNVRSLAKSYDDRRDHPMIYVGGTFEAAGGVPASNVARWQDGRWSSLGDGVSGTVNAMAVFDDGLGGDPALYCGGVLSSAGGVAANRIARWDGAAWSALGSGVNGTVLALVVFDDGLGGGPALYVAGSFTLAGGQPANRIARWDGKAWSPLGVGLNNSVSALLVVDHGLDGRGPELIVGGSFTTAGGMPASRVARWDGMAWAPIGTGVDGHVNELAMFDGTGGAEPSLYAGGSFSTAGGMQVNRIARWDGTAWVSVGGGVTAPGDPAITVTSLATYDDPAHGHVLCVGGNFSHAGGVEADDLARWDGRSWSSFDGSLGGGTDGAAVSVFLGVVEGVRGEASLIVGGSFTYSPSGDSYVARWGPKRD